MNVYMGTCGWGNSPSSPRSLDRYSQVFDAVEVAVTFNNIPPDKQLRRWRGAVPDTFSFFVKANKIITHDERLEDTQLARLALNRTNKVARALKASGVVLHLSPGMPVGPDTAERIARLALRERSPCPLFVYGDTGIQEKGAATLRETGLFPVLNPVLWRGKLSAEEGDLLICEGAGGRGYQPDNEELQRLLDGLAGAGKVTVLFKGPRCFRDAARLRYLAVEGKFIPVTSTVGADSLLETLDADCIGYPIRRETLVEEYGGLLFDLDDGITARADEYLSRLPEETYGGAEELKRGIVDMFRGGAI